MFSENSTSLFNDNNKPKSFPEEEKEEEEDKHSETEVKPAKDVFEKLHYVSVGKLKIVHPVDMKKPMGSGNLSIQKAEVGEQKHTLIKLVFRNGIGKILFNGILDKKFAKCKELIEKPWKN